MIVRGLVLCFVPRLTQKSNLYAAGSQYLEPQFYFSRIMLWMNPIFCVFTRAKIAYCGSWYL